MGRGGSEGRWDGLGEYHDLMILMLSVMGLIYLS